MAIYRRMFVVTDVVQVHRSFLETIELAQEIDAERKSLKLPPTNVRILSELKTAYRDFEDGLNLIAKSAAVTANNAIRDIIARTQKRDDTGLGNHMRDRIVSRPIAPISGFATGAVGIADETILDRRNGWYWRVQEFGSGTSEVRSITTAATGRFLRGYFYDTGLTNPTAPQQGIGTQPLFRTSGRIAGVPYNLGEVVREIKGRHFIRDGADLAEARWLKEMSDLQTETVASLVPVLAAVRASTRP